MVASYGPYSASATGGNGFARDFLAGIAAMYSVPFYKVIPGKYKLEWPTTILALIAMLFTMPIYVFYWKGAWFRERSKFAQDIASDRRVHEKRKAHLGNTRDNGPTGPQVLERLASDGDAARCS